MTRRSLPAALLALAARVFGRPLRARFGDEPAMTMVRLAADARRRGGRLGEIAYVGRELVGLAGTRTPSRRHTGGHGMLDLLVDDLRWTVRMARRRPLATLATVATLAVTIAATTAAYGVADAVLWRPLPFADAERLVLVWESVDDDQGPAAARVTSGRYADWRDNARAFTSMAAFGATGASIEGPDGALALRGVRVTANYFDTLGLRPAVGRTFLPSDERPGNEHVLLLSHGLWQRQFGGRTSVVGDTVRLSGVPHIIIGVMPPEVLPGWPVNPARVMLDPEQTEYWVPIPRTPAFDQQSRSHVYGVVARLAPGVGLPAAESDLAALASSDDADPHGATLVPLREQFVADARTPLLALLGAALAVLLIACANLAALQVTLMESRRAEFAVRAAIGAGRGRLARQLLTESLAVAGAGGVLGILLARAALAAAPWFLPPTVPLLTTPGVDAGVAAFGAAIALACGLVVSAWPVRRVSGAQPSPRGTLAAPRRAIYRGLVVTQVAVTVALVAAAGLLTQSLWTVRDRDAGFTIEGVLVADLGLPETRYPSIQDVIRFEDLVLARVAALPGVRGAALAYDHPLESNWTNSYAIVGDVSRRVDEDGGVAELRIVSPDYFEHLDVALLDGRLPTLSDGPDAAGIVVVNEAFVRSAGVTPVIGRRLTSSPPRFTWGDAVPEVFEIAGVVEDERFRGLERPSEPAVYMTTRQFPQRSVSILVRAEGDAASRTDALRATIRDVDASVTVSSIRALEAILTEQLAMRRVTTDMVGGFAALALGLAALGLYGLLVVAVAGQERELGLRLALGASPAALAAQVVTDSLRNTAAGVVAGLVLSAAAGRLLTSLLVDVPAWDPATLAFTAGLLLAVSAGAALVPALRAASIDPVRTLRQ